MKLPKPPNRINKDSNLQILFDNKAELCFEICRITLKDLNTENIKNIQNKVSDYSKTHTKAYPTNKQCGRVWFLVKENEKFLEILQVAQALDKGLKGGFFGEIIRHINEMVNGTEGKYKDFLGTIQKDEALVFYELEIDKYLERFAPKNYKQTIYEIAREYYAEASLAHFTRASGWGFYNSGMDMRALFNIFENDGRAQIDE